MRVAYVHDWLVTYRGGEKVLEALLDLYPDAPVYTLFYKAAAMPECIRRRDVRFPKWLNFLQPFRKVLLPLLPAAMESLPLEDYDLIISTSSCVAKGVMTSPEARHLCYIHSPMRYIWDQRRFYLVPARSFSPKEFLIHLMSQRLRIWDVTSNQRVDSFVANSSFVRKRVQRYYGRDASVVHPPVEVERFAPRSVQKKDYFLAAGAFVAYKRFDLAIKACEELGMKLIIAGSGPDEKKLRQMAGPNTEFVIRPDRARWIQLFQEAKAFLFPGVEDFGITAIEALAAQTPIIALRAGGALDFIREGKTGLFFEEESVDALKASLKQFRLQDFDLTHLQSFAEDFSKARFLERMRAELKRLEGST